MTTILKQYIDLLSRPKSGIVHLNDVFAESDTDPDSELTATIRNLGNFSDLRFPIGQNPKMADYVVNLLDDLIEEQKRIISLILEKTGKVINQDFSNKAVLAVINKADRNKTTTSDGKNGEDFHLAITNNGLEIYVVPLERLQALETRNKILALYRIPNQKLIVTDGNHEQFRSSIIATTRYFPEILEPVFQYKDQAELLHAKQSGLHPDVIPVQKNMAEYAFSDKFGNVRISVKDNIQFKQNIINNTENSNIVKIRAGDSDPLEVFYVTSLKEIPNGKLGIYQNIADAETVGAGYWEIVKKSEDCNNETDTACTILQNINPNFKNEQILLS